MKKDCPWGKKLESSHEYGKFGKMMKIVEREIRKMRRFVGDIHERLRICHVLEFVTGRQAEWILGL